MVALSITHIDGLEQLLDDARLVFDMIRVGSWYDAATLQDLVSQFSGHPFLYHYNRNLPANEVHTATIIDTLVSAARITGTPWLSAHLDHHTDEEIGNLLRRGRRPPHYTAEQAFDRICGAAKRIQSQLPVPLLLENVPHWPLPELDVGSTPGFVHSVLRETGCGFLLDTAHAKISAQALGLDTRAYISALPLDKLVEAHVSGTSVKDGQIVDSHEPLAAYDAELLSWLLARSSPRVVTLEYARDVSELPDQILLLKRLIRRELDH